VLLDFLLAYGLTVKASMTYCTFSKPIMIPFMMYYQISNVSEETDKGYRNKEICPSFGVFTVRWTVINSWRYSSRWG